MMGFSLYVCPCVVLWLLQLILFENRKSYSFIFYCSFSYYYLGLRFFNDNLVNVLQDED